MSKILHHSLAFAALMTSALFAEAVTSDQISEDLAAKQAALDSVAQRAQSAQMGVSPSPIGAHGNVIARMYDDNFYEAPAYMTSFKHRTILQNQANVWLTLNPNPFFTLKAALTFGADYHGTYVNKYASETGMLTTDKATSVTSIEQDYTRYRDVISTEREAVGIFEEMLISANVRSSLVSAEITLGGAQWIQMSPMLVWRRDPRHKFAWNYESYEPEQGVDAYYQGKSYNRQDYGGASTWPRRTFGGVHADIYQMPFGLKGQFLVAEPINSRATMPRATMMSHYGDAEAITSVSHPGMVFAGFVERGNVFGSANAAFGFLASNYHDDIVNDFLQQPNSAEYAGMGNKSWAHQFSSDEDPAVFEPRVFSFSSVGMLTPTLYWESDAAFSYENKRTWSQKRSSAGDKYYYAPEWNANNPTTTLPSLTADPIAASDEQFAFLAHRDGETDGEYYPRIMSVYSFDPSNPQGTDADSVARYFNADLWQAAWNLDNNVVAGLNRYYEDVGSNSGYRVYDVDSPSDEEATNFSGAYYLKLYKQNPTHNWQLEALVAGADFYSPYSLTQNTLPIKKDRMKLGVGNSVLQNNLFGATFTWIPKLSNGYLRIGLGAHAQLEKGNDVIAFQHKLLGRDWWKGSTFWSKTEPDRHWDEGRPYNTESYNGRVGVVDDAPHMNMQQDGGLFGDDYELWEEFAVYDNDPVLVRVDTARYANLDSMAVVDSVYEAPELQKSRKLSLSLSLDWGRRLTPWLFWNVYGEYNQISRIKEDENPVAPVMNEVLLMTEPVVGLGKSFAIIGMAGLDYYNADNALRNTIRNSGVPEQPDVLLGPRMIDGAVVGVENFKRDIEKSDLRYLQFAFGAGFDWDFSKRASLHVRYKWSKHIDMTMEDVRDDLRSDDQYKTAKATYKTLMDKSEKTPLTTAEYAKLSDAYTMKKAHESKIIDNDVTMGVLFLETKVWF
ncbi:MAG: hypothetical protein J6T45_07010 [Fibrobacterales bacterium]|nr:hypothetical protein [Fibrobacterales bacterium]